MVTRRILLAAAVLLFLVLPALGPPATADEPREEHALYWAAPVFVAGTCQIASVNVGNGAVCFDVEPGETTVHLAIEEWVAGPVVGNGYFHDGDEIIERFRFCDEATLTIPETAVRVTIVPWNGWSAVEDVFIGNTCEEPVPQGVFGVMRGTFA